MKKKLSLLVAISAMALGLGAAIGVGANQKAEVAKADTYTMAAGTIIYMDPNWDGGSWTGGYMGAWCHYSAIDSNKSDMWEEFWFDNLSGKYIIKLSYSCATFTMARYQSEGKPSRNHSESWGEGVWNEGNFAFESGKNYLKASGYMSGSWGTVSYHLGSTLNSWNFKDENYKMTDGFDEYGVHQARFVLTTETDGVEFKVGSKYDNSVADSDKYGELLSGTNSDFIGYNGNVVLKKAGTYELYFKHAEGGRKIWAQIDSTTEAETWAEGFVNGVGCEGSLASGEAPENWGTYAETYALLSNGAKNVLYGTEASNAPSASYRAQAAFIYDMCVKKYTGCQGDNAFMKNSSGTPRSAAFVPTLNRNIEQNFGNPAGIILLVVAGSIVLAGGYLLLRRARKED